MKDKKKEKNKSFSWKKKFMREGVLPPRYTSVTGKNNIQYVLTKTIFLSVNHE